MRQRWIIVVAAMAVAAGVGCNRSDAAISTAVTAKLLADTQLSGAEIQAETRNRVVTLTGTVDTAPAKDRALVIARQTDDVRDVIDRLEVRDRTAATSGGEAIDGPAPAGEPRADREERDGIADTARAIAAQGTATAGAYMTDGGITAAVKSKLIAATAVAAFTIDVDTKDAVVTLSGSVPTQADADRAVALALETAGVKQVVNKVRVGR
jgi:hyperosmotically inducible protein